MTSVLQTTLLYALFPVVATSLGGLLAGYLPGAARFRGLILYFAAGVVFSVVAVELLPEVLRRAVLPAVIIGFGLGVAMMLGLRSLTARLGGTPKPEVAANVVPVSPCWSRWASIFCWTGCCWASDLRQGRTSGCCWPWQRQRSSSRSGWRWPVN